jgi:Cu/Zn superoxide dismutase
MKRLLPALTAAVVGIAGTALAQTSPQTVKLNEQNKSGESGTVTITPQGNKTQVVVQLKGAPATAQPAHVHAGSCANLDPKPRIPLQNVVNGMSTTVLDMPMSEVMSGAINVHKSTEDIKTYVACGDLKAGK